jgi:hypothetical protein
MAFGGAAPVDLSKVSTIFRYYLLTAMGIQNQRPIHWYDPTVRSSVLGEYTELKAAFRGRLQDHSTLANAPVQDE